MYQNPVAKNIASGALMSVAGKYVPVKAQRALNAVGNAAGQLMAGNFAGAGMALLDSGLLGKLLPSMASGIAAQALYWGTPTPLFGGITPTEAKGIYGDMRSQSLAKKCLFLIEVSSKLGPEISERFNLFATELDYAPMTVTGEKRKLGAATVDAVHSGEPTELRITTRDDKAGSLKNWFSAHCQAAVKDDGTVGLPSEYAIEFKVVHAFITRSTPGAGQSYQNIGLFRPANLEVSLSRRDDAFEELQLVFSQLDTFMRP